MTLHVEVTFRDGYTSLHCDDLPGLNIFGDHPEKVMADFIPMWRKLHEFAPKQVMPIPTPKGEWIARKPARK